MTSNNPELPTSTIWITGLSASGKSTLSERLYQSLKMNGIENLVLLDGEVVRDQLKNYNYDTNDRNAVGIQKAQLALDYNRKGMHVIITGIAHHKETRDVIREMFPYYYEVYLRCKADKCAERDYKGHYQKAFNGEYENFVGVTEPYEESNPELVIETGVWPLEQCEAVLCDNVIHYLRDLTVNKGVS